MEEFVPKGRHSVALHYLHPSETDAILDVGCSTGYFERYYLIGKVGLVRGVDVFESAIEQAKQRDGDEYYVCSNSSALPFEDETFDKILCLDTLEHVDDEHATIAEIRRVLKPGGMLVLSVPNDFMNFADTANAWHNFPRFSRTWRRMRGRPPVTDEDLHRHYSSEQLKQMLVGFEVETVHRSSLLFPHLVQLMLKLARKPGLRKQVRKVTGYMEDLDMKPNLGFGFLLLVVARKLPTTSQQASAA